MTYVHMDTLSANLLVAKIAVEFSLSCFHGGQWMLKRAIMDAAEGNQLGLNFQAVHNRTRRHHRRAGKRKWKLKKIQK